MITLSSDFGWPYPAAMRGVILRRTDARLVDVTHQFPRQDLRASAFWLREVLPYFPPAVHLVVVDPGVGTDRAALVVRVGDHALVAPDNGVVRPVARTLAREADGTAAVEFFRVVERQDAAGDDIGWPPAPASSTFHGRDVFAPAAARVHRLAGELDDDPGFEPVETATDLRFPEAEVAGSRAVGEILVVDTFGNAVTNVPGRVARDRFGEAVTVNGDRAPVRETYARVEPGERVVTVGSHGNVELAVNQGRGDEAFGLAAGEPVTLSW